MPPGEISLAAFGKHPGWDDHITDLGDMTQRLIDVKRELYVEGIGRNIDAGTWDDLAPDQRLDVFKHLFLWRIEEDIVVGRMWSSQDGKGRKRYPMVVCAQCRGLPLGWAVRELIPRFEQLETQCVAATTADQVVSLIDSAQRQMHRVAQQRDPANTQWGIPANLLARLARRPEMGQDQEGLMRILYQVDREVESHRNRKTPAARSKHIRTPLCTQSPTDGLLLWSQFLIGQLQGSAIPALAILPLGESWVDMILGEQVGAQLHCIRVMPSKLPFTSEVPYNLDQAFVDRTRRQIEASGSQAAGSDEQAKPKRGVLSRLALVVLVVAVMIGGLYAVHRAGLIDPAYNLDPAAWVQWCLDHFF